VVAVARPQQGKGVTITDLTAIVMPSTMCPWASQLYLVHVTTGSNSSVLITSSYPDYSKLYSETVGLKIGIKPEKI